MMLTTIRLAALVAVLLGAASVSPAQSHAEELESAKSLYRDGRFSEAIARLQDLLAQLPLLRDLALRRIALADAYLHLSLSHLALGDRVWAKEALRGMIEADPARTLDPQVYAPKVIALFEEVREEMPPGPMPMGAPEPPWHYRRRTPLLLVGAGAVAVGVSAAVTLSGSEPPTAAFVPGSSSGPARIQLLSASPAPGMTVGLGLGACPRGLTAACSQAVQLTFQVTADESLTDAFLLVQHLSGATPCLEAFSSDTTGYTRLTAGTPAVLRVGTAISSRCTTPFTTTNLTAFLRTRAGQQVAFQGFTGGYTFVP